MARILVTYYSRTGNTKKMAQVIADAAADVCNTDVQCLSVADLAPKNLLDYDAIIMGSPTYYGSMAADLKKLIDDSVAFHGKLAGKIAAAFTSSGNIGGGNETTVLDILKALLIHGMIVQGSAQGDHYGPVSIGTPDDRVLAECKKVGQIVAELAGKLHG